MGGGFKSIYGYTERFGKGVSIENVCTNNPWCYSGGGGGLYGGDYGQGGSGFVYPIRKPPSIRDITEFSVLTGESFTGLNSFIEGRAQISLYYNDNSQCSVNQKTCPFRESFNYRRHR